MTERDNGGPAFPQNRAQPTEVHGGMPLRDYFAAKAMQATIDATMPYAQIAALAYEVADAMLKERAK